MTHGSVFSGIGVPEVAASMLGWTNLFHCEINDFGRKVLEYHYPNSKSYGDITKTDFSEWRGKVDVLTGGFPCQPFSTAGKRRGAEDDRFLWPYMLRVIEQIRPTWFVAENVGGIRSSTLPGTRTTLEAGADIFGEENIRTECLHERFIFAEIINQIESAGYSVQPILIPACGVGAPHRRDRIFFVAHIIAGSAADTDNEQCSGVLRTTGEQRTIREERENRQDVSGEGYGLDLHSHAERSGEYGSSTDTTDIRWGSRRTEIERKTFCGKWESDGEWRTPDHANGLCANRDATDTEECLRNDERLGEGNDIQPKVSKSGDRGGENGNGYRFATDTEIAYHTDGGRCDERTDEFGEFESAQQEKCREIEFSGADGAYLKERWRNFPTVSPVYRGNDGIPFSLDELTISPSKWATESLKAYGNAIVPQVMYEIFAAIEAVENYGK